MQDVANAVRKGANAYLAAQFKQIGPLIIIISALLYFTYSGSRRGIPVGTGDGVPGGRDL